MRRNDKEIKNREELVAVMKKAAVCHLGLADGAVPYVVPLNFGLNGDSLYFHCAREGRKLDILQRNNNVCFQMEAGQSYVPAEKGCNWTMKYRSVIGNGKAYLVDAPLEKIAALKIIMAHYSDKSYEFTEEEAGRVAVVRIDIESLSGKKSGY
jgi:nitroimidazol reductase NimA-like FMN-containing flavoprotein (pyridoxamine 5'-phosphate oxidase superfamily)